MSTFRLQCRRIDSPFCMDGQNRNLSSLVQAFAKGATNGGEDRHAY
jgi:hypothetical protein